MAWIINMHTIITRETLPRDIAACEALNYRHAEYRIEIKSHEPQKQNFVEHGREMIHVSDGLNHNGS